MRFRQGLILTSCLLGLLAFSACPPEVEQLVQRFKGEPAAKPSPAAPAHSPTPAEIATAKDRANAQLLREMLAVVYMREPKDQQAFKGYMNVIRQGASFEGLYNGFTHSSEYRQLEYSHQGALPAALKAFSEELVELESALKTPTEFTAASAQPLATPVTPEVVKGDSSAGRTQPAPPKVLSAHEYAALFVGSSIFTLKRVLGDEAIRVVGDKRDFPGKLALWYAKWVVRICERGVNFGIPLRNKADETFHYEWAVNATPDQIEWEVLNRLHRVLNEANRRSQ